MNGCQICGSEDVGDYDGEVLCHRCASKNGVKPPKMPTRKNRRVPLSRLAPPSERMAGAEYGKCSGCHRLFTSVDGKQIPSDCPKCGGEIYPDKPRFESVSSAAKLLVDSALLRAGTPTTSALKARDGSSIEVGKTVAVYAGACTGKVVKIEGDMVYVKWWVEANPVSSIKSAW